MAFQLTDGRFRAFTDAGAPAVGYFLYTYASGTTTNKATYTDSTLLSSNTNPIVLNARGEAAVWLGSGAYTFVLKTAAGVTVWTVDGVVDPQVAAQSSVLADLSSTAAGKGASLVGNEPSNAYPIKTVGRKLKERVSVEDYLTTLTPTASQALAAFQAAANSGANRVFVTNGYTINGDVNLTTAGQVWDFDGGSVTVAAGSTITNGVFYANGVASLKFIDPVIDASALSGVGGINLINCPGSKVSDGVLTKCNLNFQSTSTSTRMGYKASGTFVDMDGWTTASACYVSAAKGVSLIGLETTGGKEGIGRYNGASFVVEIGCEHYGHTQDGSIYVKCTKSASIGSLSHDNGQSGFTTQRYGAGTDTQDISLVGNVSSGNSYDGFDLRGATDAHGAWGVNMRLSAVGNIAVSNLGTGFYNVLAEGNSLLGNIVASNINQGIAVQQSPYTTVVGCLSFSNASGVGAGSSKAGILFQDSIYSGAIGCTSTNASGSSQNYGASFTGTSTDCWMIGGYYLNNSTGPAYLGSSGTAAYVVGAVVNTVTNVWIRTIDANTGRIGASGFGVPTFTAPKSSIFARTDGGGAEEYISQGGGTWTSRTIP